ncbi:hypothetical protein DD237_008130 [Peronospora effusa]|uniref:Uncharacterized protein n=1 Tax=Peronospora effusa TaxID=542832 RepID=A0A3R7VYH1_9STRA|nr:hypothetical protein DD237_008130 [Peronospora effusa]
MIVDAETELLHLQLPFVTLNSIELVQRTKTFQEPHVKNIQAIDRWRQVRSRMKQLTRGLKRCQMQTIEGEKIDATCRASILHKDFWLEALDTQHRYGFNLRAFHKVWKHEMAEGLDVCGTADASFFHWLDYGNGKNVELPECNQHELRSTLVEYCNAEQRKHYEIKFVSHEEEKNVVRVQYVASGHLVHTDEHSKWIFVLGLSGQMYLGRKRKGRFHHSSFVTGAPIFAAGKIVIKNGVIVAVEPHSGHFKPRLGNLLALCFMLAKHGVDIDKIAFVKPKKWTCAWPFPSQPDLELEDFGALDTDYGDSDESQILMSSVE